MAQQNKTIANPIQQTGEQQSEGTQRDLLLPLRYVGKFRSADTTPIVSNVEQWEANNVAPVTVTNFKHGQHGQTLRILGDGQTSVADNAQIKSGGGHLLAANEVYHFTNYDGVWHESTTSSGPAGAPGPPGSNGTNGTNGITIFGGLYSGGGSPLDIYGERFVVTPPRITAGTLSKVVIISNDAISGSITFKLKKCLLSAFPGSLVDITGGANVSMTSAITHTDSTLAGWTTAFAANDVFQFELFTVDGVLTDVTIWLYP